MCTAVIDIAPQLIRRSLHSDSLGAVSGDIYITCVVDSSIRIESNLNAVVIELLSCGSAVEGKHYVMLIPSDIDEYYSNEEHNNFRKYGYHQLMIENRYGNRFFIPSGNMKIACDILKDENMVVELVKHANLPIKVYVVTLAGKANSKFDKDFDQAVDDNI